MSLLAFSSALVAFFVTYFAISWLIRFLNRIDMVVKDQNKENKPLIPISGGLGVFAGFFSGIMVFIFLRTFADVGNYYLTLHSEQLVLVFAGFISILLVTLIGFLDDVLVHKSKESSGGLKQWQKPLLTLGAAIPLIVVNAGNSTMYLPFIGDINFGILFPLFLIPIGFIGASNMVNMLAGLNGLETGMGIIYLSSLGLYSYVHNELFATLIALMAVASLCAFWIYNKFPAKIFPGDSLTYFLGGTLATIAILGNMERAALIVSIPFFAEFFLKMRRGFDADSFGVNVNGKLHSKYEKIYSLTHLFMKNGNYTEKQIVWFFIGIELLFSLIIWVI
ncbi:MAG: UDP-N-acetylglucosamine--dolichyl-phosphate N-acetylglucosaminephosphotransferase [Nanoarchaeota archaeon]|nr:UDP-N-acetylglucosamine--dolichyl-phosphate N-acetylglucosaminephosphotransferase [Nanoarchaeota archaeon]